MDYTTAELIEAKTPDRFNPAQAAPDGQDVGTKAGTDAVSLSADAGTAEDQSLFNSCCAY